MERENEGRDQGNDDPRLMPAGNVVRWRWGIDEQGNRVKESNARIVKWSDGSTQLLIGSRVAFDLATRKVTDHHAVFAKLGAGVIERQTVVTQTMSLHPTAETQRSFTKHQAAIKAQQKASQKIRKVVMRKPVDEKAEEKLRTEQHKIRQKNQHNAMKQRETTGLTADYLEMGSSSDDTDEEADRDRRDRLQAAQSVPARAAVSDSSDSDIDMSDDNETAGAVESGASAGGVAEESQGAGMPRKKRARVAIEDDSEDED